MLNWLLKNLRKKLSASFIAEVGEEIYENYQTEKYQK